MPLWLILVLAGAVSMFLGYAKAGGSLAFGGMTGGAIAFWLGLLLFTLS